MFLRKMGKMITVTVKYLPILSEVIGTQQQKMRVVEGTTIRQLLEKHLSLYGEKFRRLVVHPVEWRSEPIVLAFINGKAVNIKESCPQGLDTPLKDGDELELGEMPLAGG